jgi:predicted permease
MRRVFRLPDSPRRRGQAVDDELRFHLEGRIEDLMEREGLSREAAEREARRRFGDYDDYRRQADAIDRGMVQRRNMMTLLESVRREIRHATRALMRSPGFTIISILTLALGLGAATAIFTLLDRVVLRPLPYPNADRLVYIATMWPKLKAGTEFRISRGQYFFFKQNSRLLEDVVFYDMGMTVLDGDGSHAPERISEIETSANAFAHLGLQPVIGRAFTTADELNPNGQARVALISYEFWQRRFGLDPSIVGRRISIDDGMSVEIIGVLPKGAAMPEGGADVWYRNHLDPNEPPINNHTHYGIGVMKPGVSVAAVQTELRELQARMQELYPRVYERGFLERTGFLLRVSSLRDHVVGGTVVRALWLVFAAVAFVLVIAAANVANLFLMRIDARRREIAMRRALGADNLHIAINTLAESVTLTLAAALLAIGIAIALLKVTVLVAPQSLPRLAEIGFDWRSAVFCLAAALASGVIFGLLPLASQETDNTVLRDGSRGVTRSRARDAMRRGLIFAEVALAVVLITGAGLMVKTFSRLRSVDLGFDPAGVHTMTIGTPASLRTAEATEQFWRTLSKRVEALPGVSHAGAASALPLTGNDGCSGVLVDVTNSAGESGNCVPMHIYTPGYLEALGVKVRGQLPSWEMVEAGSGPAVVTKAFAERFWEDNDAIGHWMKPYNRQMGQFTIVGVTDDVRFTDLQSGASQWSFFPLIAPPGSPPWNVGGGLMFVVKAPAVSTGTLAAQVRSILSQIEPKAVLADATPMEVVVARSMAQTSFTMLLLLIAASIALVLSAVGLYGVISYLVTQRRGEIGVRRALGAQAGDVTRLVVRQSLGLAAIGTAIGLIAAIAGTRLLRSLLFEVSPMDPFVLAGTVAVLLATAILAAAIPARRAARIDPVEAMRA